MDPFTQARPAHILLVEDNPGDIDLTKEALKDCKLANKLSTVLDGEQAMAFLRKEGDYADVDRPDLILLDLNLPRKGGQEVLAEVRADESLKLIPIVILTASKAEKDIVQSYDLKCNCYVTKPIDFDQFKQVVEAIDEFWFSIVKLPPTL